MGAMLRDEVGQFVGVMSNVYEASMTSRVKFWGCFKASNGPPLWDIVLLFLKTIARWLLMMYITTK